MSERIIDTGITENDLLAEVLATIPHLDRYDARVHVIADDLMRARDISRSTAMRILRKMVHDGKLREVRVIMPTKKEGSAFVRA